MRIIAKTKDCYDYLQGIYGVDDKLTYDRRGGEAYRGADEGTAIKVSINGKEYPMVFVRDKFRGNEEAFFEASEILDSQLVAKSVFKPYWNNPFKGWKYGPKQWVEKNSRNTEINTLHREPVLVQYLGMDGKWGEAFKPLHLEDYDFASVMSAHEVYIEISNFLSWCVDNPQIPDKQTDKEKVVSHGFDLKTSFRHRK
jgi:hypothetical protein